MGRLVVVTGTGTGIGKTHVSEALLRAWSAAGLSTLGLKPVESGVSGTNATDADRLRAAASVPPPRPGVRLRDPVSPHLAARRAGIVLRLDSLHRSVQLARPLADLVLVELAGGLFSPLTLGAVNADLARRLAPDATLLVAPDRLGVLHDVLATTRAAGDLRLSALALVAPEVADPSTDTNADELAKLLPRFRVFRVARAPASALASSRAFGRLVAHLSRGPTRSPDRRGARARA